MTSQTETAKPRSIIGTMRPSGRSSGWEGWVAYGASELAAALTEADDGSYVGGPRPGQEHRELKVV